MNRYIMIRRLRCPVFLLAVGVLALLAQTHLLSWSKSWPLLLILLGVLMLAERASLSVDNNYPPFHVDTHPIDPSADTGVPSYPGQPVANIPRSHIDYDIDPFERKS